MKKTKTVIDFVLQHVMPFIELIIVFIVLTGFCYIIDYHKILGLSFGDEGGESLINLYIAIVGFSSVYYAYNQFKKQNFNDIITKSRIEWTETVRSLYIEFIELAVDQQNKIQKIKKSKEIENINQECNEINKEFMDDFYRNSSKLKSKQNAFEVYFNPKDEKDRKIVKKTQDIIDYVSKNNYSSNSPECFKRLVKDLTGTISIYLKEEWDIIKKESR